MGQLLDMLTDAGLAVRDVRQTLPTHPTKAWNQRALGDATMAVIHHTGGWPKATPHNIASMHINNPMFNFPGIAYTWYLREEGDVVGVYFCHRLRDWGPHAKGVNAASFGVALGGNFVHKRPSLKMVGATVALLDVLDDFLKLHSGRDLEVAPHFAVSKTKCPGKAWSAYLAARGE